MHITLKEKLAAIYSLTIFARKCPYPKHYCTTRLQSDQVSPKQRFKKGKTNRTSKAGTGPIGKAGHSVGAKYVPGVPNRAHKPSTPITTRNDWTIRLDVMEEVWHRIGLKPTIDSLSGEHIHHLPLYRTYFQSPHASGTNAMAQVWNRHQLLHINPPHQPHK